MAILKSNKTKNKTQWFKMIENFYESENSEQIVYTLPHEAWMHIVEVYCVDENKKPSELTENEIFQELRWVMEAMRMNIKDGQDIAECRRVARECVKIMRYFEQYSKLEEEL